MAVIRDSEMNTKRNQFGVVCFLDLCGTDEKMWFIDQYHNTLDSFDVQSMRISLVAPLPVFEDTSYLVNQYGNIFQAGERIFIAPRNSNYLLIYNLESQKFMCITLEQRYVRDDRVYNFFNSSFSQGDFVYFIPGMYSRIARVNIHTCEIDYLDFGYEKIKTELPEPERVLFSDCAVIGGNAYLIFWQEEKILRLNLSSNEYEWVQLSDRNRPLSGIVYDHGFFWVTTRDEPIILKLNQSLDIVEEISCYPDFNSSGVKCGFNYLFDSDEFLFAVAGSGKDIFRVRKQDSQAEKWYEFRENVSDDLVGLPLIDTKTTCAKKISDNLAVIYSVKDAKILLVDLEKGTLKSVDAYVEDEKQRLQIKGYWTHFLVNSRNNLVGETPDLVLKDFLNAITFS